MRNFRLIISRRGLFRRGRAAVVGGAAAAVVGSVRAEEPTESDDSTANDFELEFEVSAASTPVTLIAPKDWGELP